MPDQPTYSRRKPRRFTRRSVKIEDAVARAVITVGGIGAIAAILAVGVFLVWVSWPLFVPASATSVQTVALPWSEQPPAQIAVDEHGVIGWALERPGTIRVFRLSDGLTLREQSLAQDGIDVTTWSPGHAGTETIALGLANGQARLGQVAIVSKVLSDAAAQQALDSQPAEDGTLTFPYQDGLAERLGDDRVRVHQVDVTFGAPFDTGSDKPLRQIEYHEGLRGSYMAALDEDGALRLVPLSKRATLLGRAEQTQASALEVDYGVVREAPPRFLILTDAHLYLAWPDGQVARFDLRRTGSLPLAESLDLIPQSDVTLTALAPLLGRGTLIAGDSAGQTHAWFLIKPGSSDGGDRARLTRAHALPVGQSAVTAIAPSRRSRVVAIGYEDGQVQVMHVTSARRLVAVSIKEGSPIASLAISPKEDAVIAATATGIGMASMQLHHPEASLAALFTPVWYQDYVAPAHVWQSTSGGQANEPKLGVMPLVFGTIKATVYSLLFGVPIALLAAIYTSEFLSREARGRVKPTIELMASLPSVVLGYLAAFVVAPLVARWIPSVLLSFLTIPFAFLLAAYLVQLLPDRAALWAKSHRFYLICLVLPLGAGLAVVFGPLAEHRLFGGNLIRWLDSGEGPATGGWLMLLLPVSAIVVGYFTANEVTPLLRRVSANWTPASCALADLLKFTLSAAAICGLAIGFSWWLAWLGYDPRGTYIGSYVQRNAMIVGFAMGFAIIPLIYTIAEDALSSVPEHLRSASLGAGATPWQTTVRIIIPTAMSGLFSAVMIGLGRAVGETMIVLMAAGNTPIMEWNIFNGFRTLSANLAVELPEAEQGSTHFRVLFLTALLLFAMTFVVNTVAELVRQRFRKRAYQL